MHYGWEFMFYRNICIMWIEIHDRNWRYVDFPPPPLYKARVWGFWPHTRKILIFHSSKNWFSLKKIDFQHSVFQKFLRSHIPTYFLQNLWLQLISTKWKNKSIHIIHFWFPYCCIMWVSCLMWSRFYSGGHSSADLYDSWGGFSLCIMMWVMFYE